MIGLEYGYKLTEKAWNVWGEGWCVSFSGEGAEQRAMEYCLWLNRMESPSEKVLAEDRVGGIAVIAGRHRPVV